MPRISFKTLASIEVIGANLSVSRAAACSAGSTYFSASAPAPAAGVEAAMAAVIDRTGMTAAANAPTPSIANSRLFILSLLNL